MQKNTNNDNASAATTAQTLKPGQRVTVYEDPVTHQVEEGVAILVEQEIPGGWDYYPHGPSGPARVLELWAVRFDGTGRTVTRKVSPDDAARDAGQNTTQTKPTGGTRKTNKGPYTIFINADVVYPQTETRIRDAIAFARGQVKCGNGIKVVDASGKQLARVRRGNKWC